MKKIAVIYKSHYGSTKQYAQWIAQELEVTPLEAKSVKPSELQNYDLVIYGGGLYASGIIGSELVTKNPCKKLVLFTVGLADPSLTDYTEIIEKNIPSELLETTKIFHLRGGIDYKKLSLVHRAMMAMMKKMTVDKKSESEYDAQDIAFMESYGGSVHFTNCESIMPLVEYVRGEIFC